MISQEVFPRLDKLKGYLTVDSNNLSLLSEASDLCMQLEHWDEAHTLVEKALALKPDDPVMQYKMAVILLNQRKPEDSLAITEAILATGENNPAVRYEYARGLAMAGRFEQAEPVFAQLVQESATLPELPQLYIRTLHYLGKLEDAIAFGNDYVSNHPEDGQILGMLSLLYFDAEDLDRAGSLSAKALETVPRNTDALVTAGSVALALENEGQARECFDKALSVYAENGRAWLGLGLANMLAMDLSAARSSFEKAIQHMPTHLGSHNALAWIHILQNDYPAARKTLEASLEVGRNFGETYGALATVAALENRWDEAKKLSETAIKLDSASFAGRFAQSLVLQHRGKPEMAASMVQSLFDRAAMPNSGSLREAVQRFVRRKHRHKM